MSTISSPRTRRRLAWLCAFALLAGGIATVVALLPDQPRRSPQAERLSSALPAPAGPKPRRLTAADRRAINATLDAFVPSAVRRQNVGDSYELTTTALRNGQNRRQWARGDIGVYPYPALGRQFHGWTVDESTTDGAWIQLLLKPRAGAKVGPILFDISLKRRHGNWLVDSFVPTATFAPLDAKPQVRAANDFLPGPGPPVEGRTPDPGSRLGHAYAVIPFAILAAVLVGLVGWGVAARYRDRRISRLHHEHKLPPLPPLSIRADGSRARTAHRP